MERSTGLQQLPPGVSVDVRPEHHVDVFLRSDLVAIDPVAERALIVGQFFEGHYVSCW
jgi:hypothetical protein